MIITITHREIRQGAKGDYLYIKYVTDKGKESGKTVFKQLKDKWGFCQENATVNLTLDERYNIIDIQPITEKDLPPPTKPWPMPPEPQTEGTKEESRTKASDKNRAFALSYAKDIEVALIQSGKIEKFTPDRVGQILLRAETFNRWLNGEEVISSQKVAQYIQGLIKSQIKQE